MFGSKKSTSISQTFQYDQRLDASGAEDSVVASHGSQVTLPDSFAVGGDMIDNSQFSPAVRDAVFAILAYSGEINQAAFQSSTKAVEAVERQIDAHRVAAAGMPGITQWLPLAAIGLVALIVMR